MKKNLKNYLVINFLIIYLIFSINQKSYGEVYNFFRGYNMIPKVFATSIRIWDEPSEKYKSLCFPNHETAFLAVKEKGHFAKIKIIKNAIEFRYLEKKEAPFRIPSEIIKTNYMKLYMELFMTYKSDGIIRVYEHDKKCLILEPVFKNEGIFVSKRDTLLIDYKTGERLAWYLNDEYNYYPPLESTVK